MINTHPKMLDEILAEVNLAETPEMATKLLVESYKQPYVKFYLDLAVNAEWTTIDPDDTGAKQYEYHRSMCGAMLLNRHTTNIISSVIMRKDIPDVNKTRQLKSLFEMLHQGESALLLAVFKKNIQLLYPNITFAVINSSLD